VDAVDVDERPDRVRPVGDPPHVGPGAGGVAGGGQGDQAGALGEQRVVLLGGQLGGRGSTSAQRTVAPAAGAACTHGRTSASWSSRDTTTSSPGRQVLASAPAST
jgi:hypothetical protein